MVTVTFTKRLILHKHKQVYYVQVPKALCTKLKPETNYTIIITDKLTEREAIDCINTYTQANKILSMLKELITSKFGECITSLVELMYERWGLAPAVSLAYKINTFSNISEIIEYLKDKIKLFEPASRKILLEYVQYCAQQAPNINK